MRHVATRFLSEFGGGHLLVNFLWALLASHLADDLLEEVRNRRAKDSLQEACFARLWRQLLQLVRVCGYEVHVHTIWRAVVIRRLIHIAHKLLLLSLRLEASPLSHRELNLSGGLHVGLPLALGLSEGPLTGW